MVHDLTVGSHQRVGVEGSVAWQRLQQVSRRHLAELLDFEWATHQQASQRRRLRQTTSHTLSHNSHLLPGTSAPRERCSLGSQQRCHSGPCQSAQGQDTEISVLRGPRLSVRPRDGRDLNAGPRAHLPRPKPHLKEVCSCFYRHNTSEKIFDTFVTNTQADNPQSPFSCTFQSRPAWGVRFCRAACCLAWRPDEWSPWSEWHPGPSPPLRCRTWPISPAHRRCWWDWPGPLLACTPSPCRGSAHLGRRSTTE